MSEEEIFDEIRSVFRVPMGENSSFSFDVLQPTGGKRKELIIPALSSSYKWTASSIVPKNAKSPLYIIAKEPLIKVHDSDEEEDFKDYLIDLTKEEDKANDGKPKQKDTWIDCYSFYDSIMDEGQDSDHRLSPTPPPVSPLTPVVDENESLSVSDILQHHRRVYLPVDNEDRTRIAIRRRYILDDTLHAFREGLNMSKYLKITFLGEAAVDAEFRGTLCLSWRKKTFYYVGAIIGLSIIHGGPAPQFFSDAVADYIVCGVQHVKATIEDVPEYEIRKSLERIRDTTNEDEFHRLLSEDIYDYRFDIGVSLPVDKLQFNRKSELISSISKHFAILQVKAELDQMLCGLSDTLHVLDVIRENPVVFRPLFVYFKRPLLTADDLFDKSIPQFSTSGSNVREKEEAVTMLWIDFLRHLQENPGKVNAKDCTYNLALEDIMMFTIYRNADGATSQIKPFTMCEVYFRVDLSKIEHMR